MKKYILVAIVSAAYYFLIFKDSDPKTVEFIEHTLRSKIDNNNSRNKDLNFLPPYKKDAK
jgi:hypothetical protein